MGSPVTSQRKEAEKDQWHYWMKNIQKGCVSQDSAQNKSILREIGKLGPNHAVKFSKTTMRHAKIRERMGPSQGVMQKCPWAPKFEERTQDETLKQ